MSAKIESELEKANRELTLLKAEYQEFVDIVSHDLEAPLRQIKGFSEIIVSKHGACFDEKSKRHFELIQNGSTQATQMLAAVKNYSRLNTRAKPFTLLDCNNSVAEALDTYQHWSLALAQLLTMKICRKSLQIKIKLQFYSNNL